MTEKRKQELRQLLQEAKKSLVIRYKFGGRSAVPVDVYREYLEERWKYFGIDFLSFAFSIQFAPDIADQSTRSNLLHYMREELAPFISKGADPDDDCIQTASYSIESNPTIGAHLVARPGGPVPLFMVLARLLEIALVRGIQAAVSFFDRCRRPEGTQIFLRDVAFLEGVKIESEIELFNGVRLVPLPSGEISSKVKKYLPDISVSAFTNHSDSFFGRTLLVIDRPVLAVLSKTSEKEIQNGTRVDDLPFQVEVPEVKFTNHQAVGSFDKLFCHALSLGCSSAVKIVITGFLLQEENSFNQTHGPGRMFRYFRPMGNPPKAQEAEIEKAKCLYEKLDKLNTRDQGKLQIAIDRWIESKTNKSRLDKIIDLGIAFEALYAPDSSSGEIRFKLAVRGAWNLGENEKHRMMLMKEFQEIYDWRSKVVHTGNLPNKTKNTPFTSEEIKQFIENAQDLCRKSILKVLEDGRFPDWNSLILGDGTESNVEDRAV